MFNIKISAGNTKTGRIPADLRSRYSVAWLDDGSDDIPANAMPCPGNCENCGACWGLAKRGIDVKFAKH